MLTLAKLRAYQLVFARLGEPDAAQRELALSVLDPMYPLKRTRLTLSCLSCSSISTHQTLWVARWP